MGLGNLRNLHRHYAGQAGQLVEEFYVPVLSEAVRYDRQAGFFDSGSLVQLASGLAAFIRHQRASFERADRLGRPPMRLITGATWSPNDIAAYQRGLGAFQESLNGTLVRHFEPSDEECLRLGLPQGWRPEEDDIARNRIGTLAWMVANGILDVRVALPLDPDGRPYTPGRHGALYHPKSGILYDSDGLVVSFQGSVNETGAAWVRNREKFEVKRSWYSQQDREDIEHEIAEFEAIWEGRDTGLLVLGLPEAVRERLLRFVPPDGPPPADPMESNHADGQFDLLDRIRAQWLLDAPRAPGGEELVLGPLWADGHRLQPYPHQTRVYQRALHEFPRSYLFCDEVGLGKTIEAGLLLRSLIIKGEFRRVLLLVPRSLVRQWMEELREKFALTAWFFDGQMLQDVAGNTRSCSEPWSEAGLVIASRQLVVRRDRRDDFLSPAEPWDAILVDEAHAARRRVMGSVNEPNLSLEFLQEIHGRGLCRCLWLLTATPMQLAPHEVHDLLLLCGLDDASWRDWTRLDGFTRFFDQLTAFPRDTNARAPVLDMARVAVQHGAPELDESAELAHWSRFAWRSFVTRIRQGGAGLSLALRSVKGNQAESLAPLLSRQSPLAVHMFRYTRSTLRAYQERGLIRQLAVRVPEDVPVDFRSQEERVLYERIDELCRHFYRSSDLAPEERSGIGFLMAVFRKRLSSSFVALQRSLERRRAIIESVQSAVTADEVRRALLQEVQEEPEEAEDQPADVLMQAETERLRRIYADPRRRQQLEAERRYLQDYAAALSRFSRDSKFEVFADRLADLLSAGQRVIVFTQYVDTMDFIRGRLVSQLADRIACYSGRGGEVWDAAINSWRIVDKAEVKARCNRSHARPISVLLGTDAASEGLNLQQFSTLFNYDLPWNPMRVEQRIGRIDRIGQDNEEVQILNLYMRGTIEEDAYFTLRDRIGVFEDVVGPLQPILEQMPQILRRVARGELELAEARRLLEDLSHAQPTSALANLEDFACGDAAGDEDVPAQAVPATQEQLATWCLAHPAPGMRVNRVPEPGNSAVAQDPAQACLSISWPQAPPTLGLDPMRSYLATFSGEVADRHPATAVTDDPGASPSTQREGVRLLTWGDPFLTAWLEAIRGGELTDDDYSEAGISREVNPMGMGG